MSLEGQPPVLPVIWTQNAKSHLRDIAAYISADSPQNAEKMVERLLDSVALLGRFPWLHRVSQRITKVPDAREISIPPYLVVYRVSEQAIMVLAVVHGRQKFPRP
ncbi:MAG: type II toxin-antitoxin system RelE/ParE family toxin [Lautropia sp.]|nr:type II toxin-antitoxin system RelE/ParE family toxin [Lautropia sp.]